MASLMIGTNPPTWIDYSMSGEIRRFELLGETLFDALAGVATDGWRSKLVETIREHGLDEDDGQWLHAFVYRMMESGELNKTA